MVRFVDTDLILDIPFSIRPSRTIVETLGIYCLHEINITDTFEMFTPLRLTFVDWLEVNTIMKELFFCAFLGFFVLLLM